MERFTNLRLLLAGSRALDGDLIIEASHDGASREIDRLGQRLSDALARRSSWQREADRWMAWFVPSVVVVAAVTFAFWTVRASWSVALFNSLAVLLVACPCALGLGVPIAVWRAMNRLICLGIAPSTAELVERLARVRTVVFDKTGTLTEGQIRLQELVTTGDPARLRGLLAVIESRCDHPVARPFSELLAELSAPPREQLVAVKVIPGQGVVAQMEDAPEHAVEVRIGNRSFLGPQHTTALAALRDRQTGGDGERELFVLEDDTLTAIARLKESVRPGLSVLAADLGTLGLELRIMTGDTSPDQGWAECGLAVSSGMSTSEKAAAVRKIEAEGKPVLFVGDGLNDSEAMSAATASLALHEGDTTARAQAHGELRGGALGAIPEAIATSRQTRRTVRQILAVSLTYNATGLLLAPPAGSTPSPPR